MDVALVINIVAVVGILLTFVKDKEKAIKSVKIAIESTIKILPMLFTIVLFIGLLLGFVSPEQISKFIGKQSGLFGILIVGIIGALMQIPALLSFPLAASLLKNGASVSAIATFITTLTMVGTITLPLEIKELGKKMALLRNGISFVIAIIIALIMGIML